ncbi:MAG: hypothetical protein IKW45_06575 [Clostridia bacterium]|nr:hypothetical protein [Clostridia bacterium]
MKEKQIIEEMAKCIANCVNTCDECFEQIESVMTMKIKNREQHCTAYMYAKRAVEQGYRKLPEEFITVSEFEYKDLKYRLNSTMQYNSLLQKEIDEVKEELSTCVEIKNQSRKEKVKEILDKVDNESYGQTKQITDLLRKQYGVEVEE